MLGNKQFELSNLPIAIGIGNVLTTVSDRKIPHTSDNITIDYYTSDITSAQDYYAFGQLMPGRNWSSDSYKFGFNGQEKDDEISGNGNHNTALFWEYDTRLGRRWNVDPLANKYPSLSPYAYCANNPVMLVDPDGRASTTPYWKDEITGKIVYTSHNNEPKTITGDWKYLGETITRNDNKGNTIYYDQNGKSHSSVPLRGLEILSKQDNYKQNGGNPIYGNLGHDVFQMPDCEHPGQGIDYFNLFDFWGMLRDRVTYEMLKLFGVFEVEDTKKSGNSTNENNPSWEKMKTNDTLYKREKGVRWYIKNQSGTYNDTTIVDPDLIDNDKGLENWKIEYKKNNK